jgi:hypothetical protein
MQSCSTPWVVAIAAGYFPHPAAFVSHGAFFDRCSEQRICFPST